jgi:hypothetical protein
MSILCVCKVWQLSDYQNPEVRADFWILGFCVISTSELSAYLTDHTLRTDLMA